MKIKSPFVVTCKKCGKDIPVELGIECVGSYERKMGPELEYQGVYEGKCVHCDSEIDVEIEAWEYPEGTVETYNVKLIGALKVEEPEFDF